MDSHLIGFLTVELNWLPSQNNNLQNEPLHQNTLHQANSMLDTLIELQCQPQGHTFNIQHFDNVLRNYFINEVQICAAQLSKRYYSLIDAYRKLELRLEKTEPAAYKAWRVRRDQNMFKKFTYFRNHTP